MRVRRRFEASIYSYPFRIEPKSTAEFGGHGQEFRHASESVFKTDFLAVLFLFFFLHFLFY